MAHKKGQGSTRNGRDSNPQYRGIKAYGGETVTIGSPVGDGKVISIGETEVVLSGPGGRQVLKLNPEVDKTVRQPAPAKAAEKPAQPESGKKQP